MSIKGILLDIDNTLYPYEPTHQAGMKAVFAYLLDLGVEHALSERLFRSARKYFHAALAETASAHNRMLYFQRLCEELGLNSLHHSLPLYDAYWNAFLERMRPDEGMDDFLQTVKHIPICLVTDLTAHIQHRKIEKLGLANHVQHVVTSEEAGREKPDPRIFLLALEKLGLTAADCCMIGDNYDKDIRGAIALGMPSFWLIRESGQHSLEPGITKFHSFKDLKEHFYG